jgi:hypothetical protein
MESITKNRQSAETLRQWSRGLRPGRVPAGDQDWVSRAGRSGRRPDRGDDVVPEGEQRRYGPGGRAGQVVAAGAREFANELLAAEFTQVVGGLAGVVGGVVSAHLLGGVHP